jgi:hypothetical protein
MQDLTRDLRTVLDNSIVKQLLTIVQYFDPHGPQDAKDVILRHIEDLDKDERVNTEDLPQWMQLILQKKEDMPACVTILLSTLTEHDPQIVAQTKHVVLDWLQRTMYSTAPFVPHIIEENARNLALGHPIALWLFDHAQDVDLLCTVGMILMRPQGNAGKKESLPSCLVRLPIMTQRARSILFPELQKVHNETIEILPESYIQLFVHEEKK